MDTETVGIIGLFGLLFVIGTALSLFFAVVRKPFERFIERIIPGGRFSGQISRGMRISVDPDAHEAGRETFSVNLTSAPLGVMIDNERSDRRSLSDGERSRYIEEWAQIQRGFRENPADAVRAADELLKDLVKVQGSAQVSLRRMHESKDGNPSDFVAAVMDVYNVARNARSAARGIALSRANENASIEDLSKAMSYYEALFDALLVNDLDETTPRSPRASMKSVEGNARFPWVKGRAARMTQHRETTSTELALRSVASKLEIVVATLLGALVLVIPAVAILIMATMDDSSRAQGGRFYVAIAALALLGAVNSQISRMLRRRAPGITTSSAERRHAALSLILLPTLALVLVGLALRLP